MAGLWSGRRFLLFRLLHHRLRLRLGLHRFDLNRFWLRLRFRFRFWLGFFHHNRLWFRLHRFHHRFRFLHWFWFWRLP